MTARAEAAYAAYCVVTDYKNYQGKPMPEFEDLTPQIKLAWDAACEGVLRHWLENEFKTAVMDDALLEAYAGRMLAVGVERNDPPLKVIRAAVASFVHKVIDPTFGQQLKLKRDPRCN